MELHPYWHQQTKSKPLYPDIEWSKPEQRSQRGRLVIIGGNKLGFTSVAENYSVALENGAGEVRVLLPDILKKAIPAVMTDVVFGASNPSGGLARDALGDMVTAANWATGVLLIGDAGRNSETAVLYEEFARNYTGTLTITRDAIDLFKNSPQTLVDRPETLLVLSFAQLQKLFQSVYYPKVLTFSMQLTNLVEALHKFTTTYPISIAVLFKDNLLTSSSGEVTSTQWESPMDIWRGKTATVASVYWLWNQSSPLKSVTASLVA